MSKKGLSFSPCFATTTQAPFDEIRWTRRSVTITDDGGREIFRQDDVEIPAGWSELAAKIAVSKYFHGDINKGLDPTKGGREHSIRQLIYRVAHTITTMGSKDGYFATISDADIFEKDLTWLLVNQYGAFNSPVWFNVGLHHQYGFGHASSEGNYVFNRETNRAFRPKTQYEYPQGSACFIQKVEDNMESIMALATAEAMLFKFGSGSGTDLSTLRSSRERLSGGGKPSGPMSFLRVYDGVARVVKSGGKTRRAAKMNTLNATHPDVEEFVEAKSKEERKAWALIEQGYDGSFNGEAYDTVAFQNENLSLRVTDEFMEKAQRPLEDAEGAYDTIAVTTGKPVERKHARDILRKVAEGTYLCGDPGMQFDTTIQRWHTCAGTEPIHSTNPCSEYVFLDNTACNLASLNLMKFKQRDGLFDIERFKAAVRIFITAQDIIVDNASYPTAAIAINSHIFRTLGLGYANLGALLMSYGMPYDSEEGRTLAACITSIMTGEAYCQSVVMAERLGAFDGLADAQCFGVKPLEDDNCKSMMHVMELHRKASGDIPTLKLTGPFGMEFAITISKASSEVWERAIRTGTKHGYRNAQVTVLAPTGTIGFLMDCDTTGIEPETALVKYKLLAGGGMLKIVNQTVEKGLEALGYSSTDIHQILNHIEKHDTIEDVEIAADDGGGKLRGDGNQMRSRLKPEHLAVFDCAFKAHKGTRSLGYMAHLGMMAAAQPFLSGAISKTVNLPEAATVEDIMNTYMEGWKMGLKAIAIYRDGSKRSAPLNVKKTKDMGGDAEQQPNASTETLVEEVRELKEYVASLEDAHGRPVRKKMPDERDASIHKFEVAGHKGYLAMGMFDDGSLGEIFIQMNKEGSTIGGLMDTVATLTSISLQYGVPLESLVKKFAYQRFEPSGFTKNPDIRNATSIADYIFRFLGCKFIKGYRENTAVRPRDIDVGGLAHIRGESPEPAENKPKVAPKDGDIVASDGQAFLPDPCSVCGSLKVVRTGACGCCTVCGTSAGCS